jgi:type IV pilus assembly protein PilE
LIEVMIVVAIIAILAAIAIPSYRDYIIRGELTAMTTQLSAMRSNMERYYQDNRVYTNIGAFVSPCTSPPNVSTRFTLTCVQIAAAPAVPPAPSTAAGFTFTATGATTSVLTGFTFTINGAGLQTSTSTPAGWATTPANCWLIRRGMVCP